MDCKALNFQIKNLKKEIEILKSRELHHRQCQAEINELRNFINGAKLFMLRLAQGKVPFDVLTEHLGHKVSHEALLKLNNTIINQPQHLSRRSLVILYHLYGIGNKIIREFLYISRNTVKRYIHKFNEGGVESLLNTHHKAIHVLDDPKIKETILSILHTPPREFGYNRTSWTIKLLTQALDNQGCYVAKNNVSKIIKKAGYRFWKAKEVLTSNDPKYREKLEEITKILSNLKSSERFFSIDEFGPFAVKQRGGRSLVHRGEYPTVPQFQPNKGSLIVTAALELSSNQITHFYSNRKNSDEIIKMLHILIKKYSDCENLYLSWDHASWHSSKVLFAEITKVNSDIFRMTSKTPIVKLAPLPAMSQFLNVIESIFSGMANSIIQNSNYDCIDEAKEAIDRYFRERNEYYQEHPKRAGNKIWGKELVVPDFKEGQNCKNKKWR